MSGCWLVSEFVNRNPRIAKATAATMRSGPASAVAIVRQGSWPGTEVVGAACLRPVSTARTARILRSPPCIGPPCFASPRIVHGLASRRRVGRKDHRRMLFLLEDLSKGGMDATADDPAGPGGGDGDPRRTGPCLDSGEGLPVPQRGHR